MSEGKNVPKLRFPEFTDAWELHKLGELVEFYNGDRSSRYPNEKDMVSEGVPFINAGDLISGRVKLDTTNKITEKKYNELSGAKIKRGDIIYCLRGTLGKNAFVDNFDVGTLASSLVDIRPKKVVGKYLFQILNSDIELRQRTINDEGAAQPNLSAKNLSSFNIPMTSEVEQNKIAVYFDAIDNLITLNQRKYDSLLEYKKAMLQKMFPKDGETEPEIRFPGFSDAWEQRKLGDVTEVITKGTTPHDKSWVGPVNYIRTESIDKETGLLSQTCATSIEEHEGYLKRSQLKENDVLFSIVGTMGRVGLVKSKDLPANTNQQIAIIRLKEMYPEFVLNALKTPSIDSYVGIETTIGAQPSLSLWQIEKMEIPVPCYREQEKIGVYFNNLDNLITLHQRKLNLLKEYKKGLLQQMFI